MSDPSSGTDGSETSWLAWSAAALLALLLAGQVAVIVLLRRIGQEARIFAAQLNIRERQMRTQPEPPPPGQNGFVAADDGPGSPRAAVPHHEAGPGSSAAPSRATAPDAQAEAGPAASTGEPGTGATQGGAAVSGGDAEAASQPTVAPLDAGEREDGAGGDEVRDPSVQVLDAAGAAAVRPPSARSVRARAGVRQRRIRRAAPRPSTLQAPETARHALYARARARLAEIQEERGEKDRERLAAAAARFERRRAWVLALHEDWENDVDFAYLALLQKPGAGAVKDPYVMVYPLSEHDWEASRRGLSRLARDIDALPDTAHPHWPALLPLTALRSSVDFDLRVQPPDGASPAAAFHARRVLATLLVNLKTLRRAQAELGRLVQWVTEAAPGAEARLADVSPQALAILDALCAAGRSEEERETEVDAAITALDAVDSGNFDAVRAAEDRAEKLEQRYRAFLKVLFRAVDGIDRARALHDQALQNGVGGEAWLGGWGAILEELDGLLVGRILGGRLEIAPIPCGRGDALDTDLHNPLGAEPVPGVDRDQVWRVESRGFAFTENGVRQVVQPVDVIVAVPAA